MAKNLPNHHFSDLKQFLLAQGSSGSSDIGAFGFQCGRGDDNLPMNTAKALGGFKKLLLPLLTRIWIEIFHSNFYSLIDESTDIATDHNLVIHASW